MNVTVERAADHSDLEGRRILIVEDEMLLAMDLEEILEKHGCVVLGSFPDVERALDAVSGCDPDAVLLDMNLGGRSSAPIVEDLLRKRIPFIVITGYTELGDLEAMGIDARKAPIVKKPYDEETLLRALRTLSLKTE